MAALLVGLGHDQRLAGRKRLDAASQVLFLADLRLHQVDIAPLVARRFIGLFARFRVPSCSLEVRKSLDA